MAESVAVLHAPALTAKPRATTEPTIVRRLLIGAALTLICGVLLLPETRGRDLRC